VAKENRLDSAKEIAKRLLESHLTVGPDKPVSYLPIRTIEEVIGMSVDRYVSLIEQTGNQYAVFGVTDSCINSGAVYAYNRQGLAKILNENRDVLTQHGWPAAVDDFIRRIASEWLDPGNPITAVIRKSFGEG
jgi:hypothetical protein